MDILSLHFQSWVSQITQFCNLMVEFVLRDITFVDQQQSKFDGVGQVVLVKQRDFGCVSNHRDWLVQPATQIHRIPIHQVTDQRLHGSDTIFQLEIGIHLTSLEIQLHEWVEVDTGT
ncbi:hypothetical protein OGAPHI_000404 [Ogataea philodendri]|uniref:Uncharacterized protein n=1 Tax=Ogataea philodendri TaxID=1378263 RepID=A0A9P8PI75_9ASCO|nr:uncharacterized protein OGAPHI_000404 [Ogataea philodendri]KAH3671699.1 hypothetical protein OGAPHI_000404 [Ogataea philodendri]